MKGVGVLIKAVLIVFFLLRVVSTTFTQSATTISVQINNSNDDVEEESSGSMYYNSSDLELVDDTGDRGPNQKIGLRFTNVAVPQGATITNAYIEFEVDETTSVTTTVSIACQDIDDAPAFGNSSPTNVSGRTLTSAVSWASIPAWNTTSEKKQTPDLSSIIQSVVDRGGWSSGNDLAIIITGSGERVAESYDGEPGNAPTLYITYMDCDITPGSINIPSISCPDNNPSLITELTPAESSTSCNSITNHEFDNGTTDWDVWLQTGNSASLSIDNGSVLSGINSCLIDISSVTGTSWHIEYNQEDLSLTNGETYALSFEAKAASSRTATIDLQLRSSPWTVYWSQNINLTTTPQTFSYTGIDPGVTSSDIGFMLKLGESTSNVWVDNVNLSEEGCSGTMDYQWQKREDNGSGGWTTWSDISGATSASYDPPAISLSTQYRRRAKLNSCSNWESSNTVEATLQSCGEICDNGIDDDGDGLIDCADPDCALITENSTDIPKVISASSATTITSTINISESGNITDVNLIGLDIQHDYIDDLIISLSSPEGTTIVLLSQPCNSEDDILMDLDDEAASGSYPCPPTNGLDYIPLNALSAFDDEEVNGIWTLSVQDVYGPADGGSLDGWGLEIGIECDCPTGFADAGVDQDICIGESATLTASGGISYVWSHSAGSTSSVTVSPSTTTTYTVTVTDASGCTESDQMIVTVNPLPNLTVTDDGPLSCAQSTVTITASSTTTGATYEWGGGNSCLVSDWDMNEGSGIILEDKQGNVPDATIVNATWITRSGGGTALDFDGTDDYIDLGNDSDLQITGDMTISMWLRPEDFSSRRNPWSKAYGGEGTMTQELSGHLNFYWGTAGANTSPYTNLSTTSSLTLNTWTHVTFVRDITNNEVKWFINGAEDNSGTPSMSGSASSLTAKIGRGYVSDYNGGIDGVKIFNCALEDAEVAELYNNTSSTYEVTNPGDYTVTVTDPSTDCTATITTTITGDNTVPTADAGVDQDICNGESANLTASGGTSFAWSNGAGSTATVSVSPSSTTTYTVTVTGSNGCTDTDQVIVTVNSLPTASAGADQDICVGENATLTASGGTTYAWSNSAGNTASVNVSPIVTTTYTVMVTDGNGCTDTDQVVVSLYSLPNANAGVDQDICNGESATLTASGGTTYVWSDGAGSTASVSVNPSSTTTYTVTVTDGNGCTDTDQIIVTVNSLPTANAGSDQDICIGDTATLTASGGASYVWSNGAGSTASVSVSPATTTTYSVTATDGNGCTDTDQVIVTVNSLPTANAGSDEDICLGETVTLTATGGVSYTWSNGAGNTASVNVSPETTTTYTVTATDVNGCTDTDQVVVSLIGGPTANAGSDQDICLGDSATLTASGGISYVWSNSAGNTASVTVNPSSTTTYSVTVTAANGCTDTDQIIVTVNNLPTANAGADQDICIGDSSTLTASGGISYVWSHAAGSTVSVNVSPVTTTTYTVTATDANGCTDSDQVIVTVFNLPTVSLTLSDDEDCSSNNTLILSGGLPAGGVYSGTGVTGNNFNATNAGVGSHTITYTYTDANGCANNATDVIQVFDLPTVTLALTIDADCIQNNTLLLSGGLPSGGSYSGTGVSGTNFDASTAGIGIHTITYTYTDGNGCTNTSTDDIEVYALPNVAISLGDDDACISESTITLSGGTPAGGSYSGTGVSGTTFNVATAGIGTHTITYSYTDGSGCNNTATDFVVVSDLPTVNLTITDSEDCVNNSTHALTGGAPSGGVYSGTGVTGSNFNALSAGVGVHTITYTYTDGNGCVNADTGAIEVFGIPTVSLTLPTIETCVTNTTTTLSGGSPVGGSFSGPGVSGTNFDASSAGVGNHTITYTYTDGNGCANTATDIIEVLNLPSVSLSLVDDGACIDESTITLSGGLPSGGTYSGTGVSGTNFNITTAGIGSHTITYTYTDGNGCINNATDVVEIFALPTVTLSLFNSEDCVNNSTLVLSGGSPVGGTYTGTGVSGTNFDASSAGLGNHTITYTYTDSNGCTNATTDVITVVNVPTVTLTLGDDDECVSSATLILSGGSPSGGSYSGTEVTGSNFDASNAGVGSHTIIYTYDTGNGCSNTASDIITVHALPTVTLSLSSTDFCFGETSIALSGGLPLGGTYSGTGVSGSNFNTTISGPGTFQVTYSYTDANGCSNTASQNVIVHDLPTVTLTLSDDLDCVTESTHALDGGIPSGGTYSGTGVSGTNFDASVAGLGTHQITYTYTDAFGCINFATDNITVDGVPNPTLTLTNDEICVSESTLLLDGGSPSGGTFSGAFVTGNNFDPSAAGVGVHTVTYSVTVSGCTSFVSDDITVYALPSVTLTLTTDTDCFGSTNVALTGGSPAGGTWSGPGVSGSNFNSTLAGVGSHTVVYTYTDANGCVNTADDVMTVYSLPTVSLSLSDDEACVTETSLTLDGGNPAGGSFSGTGVTGTTFDPSVAGSGLHQITYSYTDGNGCTNNATQLIQVFDQPTVTLSLVTSEACLTETNVALSGGLPIGGTYSGTGVSGTTFDPSSAGTGVHTITYSYTINGCTNTASETIEVYNQPSVLLTLGDDEFCFGESGITLTGGSPAGGTYSGNGIVSNVFNSLLAGVGTHTVVYSYTDANGCSANATDVLTVHDLPSATLTLPTITACSNETNISLSGGLPSGGVYSGTGVSGTSFNATTAGLGTHIISYTYTDANGCEAIAIDEIVVFPMPNVTFSYEAEYCDQFDGTVTFTFIDQPVITEIEFSLNGGITWKPAVDDNSITVTYGSLASGTYTLLVRNVNGTCSLNLGNITIGEVDGPTANAGNDVTITAGQSTTLNGSGSVIYTWTPSGSLNNTSIYNPVATPSETTTYTLTVSDLHGCTDIDQVTVTVILPCAGVITDYPYSESFESGLGLWSQNNTDDFDWTRQTGATPSSNTGPTSASNGSYYMYTESSSPNNPNKTAIFESPCFDLTDHSCAQVTFDYHMYGSTMGNLELEITTDNGLNWASLWSISGDQGNTWFTQEIDLFGYLGEDIQLRFIAESGSNYGSDIAIDNIEFITSGCGCDATTSPFLNFDLFSDPFPFSIDLDNDGDADMIVGTDSLLFYYQNNGDGTYTDITDTGSDPLPNISFKDMTLAFADLDGDGDEDMSVVGDSIQNSYFYWNTGSASNAVFTLAGTGGTPASPIAGFDYAGLDGGYWIGWADCTIFYVDLDNDGDFDACMGGKLGWFQYYENTGDETSPNFVQRTGAANPFNGFRTDGEDEGNGYMQYESSPFFVDWDGDGDYDMFSGNQVATIEYYENIGTPTNPVFVQRTGTDNPFDNILFTEDTHISIIDEDCDGDWDVFYGDGDNDEDADLIMCDLLVATPNQAIANADLTHYCVGETIYFTEAGTTGAEWSWSGPNGFTSSLQDPTIASAELADGGTYYVTVTNEQGCESVDSITISVSIASADAGENQTIDLGNSTQLDGTGQGVYYTWTPTTGLDNPNIPNPNANPTETTTYTLTVTNATGCNSTDQVTIFVITDECEEEENIFTADFENTIGDNYWVIGSGATDGNFEIATPYPYIQSGITVMELTPYSGNQDLVTGNNYDPSNSNGQDLDGGPSSATSRDIVLSPTYSSVEISLYYYFAHYTNGDASDYLTISVKDASNDATLSSLVSEVGAATDRDAVWAQVNGDLSAHIGKTIYIYVEAADLGGGSKLEVGIDDVVVNGTYTTQVDLELDIPETCSNDTPFTLTGGSPTGGVYTGTGVTGSTFDPSMAGVGTHTIVYTYTTASGCVASTSDDLVVLDPPSISLTLALDEACETQTTLGLFGGLPTGGVYSGTAVTGNNFDPSVAGIGTHVITYTVTDANGCTAETSDNIEVYGSADIISVTETDATCGVDNGTITISFDNVAGITSIEFSLDGGTSWQTAVLDNAGSVTYSSLAAGTYDLWVQDVDEFCTIDIEDATIGEFDGPSVDAGPDQTICDGESTDINPVVVGGEAPLTFAWSGPNSYSASTLDITVTTPGTYVVTVTDDNDCFDTDAVVISSYTIQLSNAITGITCYGDSDGQVIASASGGTTPYTFALSGEGSNTTGIFNNLSAGFYTITLTDNAGCEEILPIAIDGPPDMVCVQDSCIRALTSNWSGGTSGPWSADIDDVDITVSFTHDSNTAIVSSSVNSILTTNTWFSDDAENEGSLQLGFSWDDSPEASTDDAVDDAGTATMTITFSEEVECPVIHLDRLGVALNGASTNSSIFTLTSSGTLAKLSGTGDLTVTPTQIYKVPNVQANVSQGEATDNSYNGAAAGSVQVVTAGPITSITFDVSGIGVEGTGTDIFEMAITATRCFDVDPTSFYCSDNSGSASIFACGGTTPYTFLWDNGETTSTATDLAPGTHSVTITDANGCEEICSVIIEDDNLILDAGANVSFCDTTTNVFTPVISAGIGPFVYSWTGPGDYTSSSENPTISTAGTYILQVTDASGCTGSDTVEAFVFPCDQTSECFFLDEFNTFSYFGSDGTLDWTSYGWSETGDNNSSASGEIQISNNSVRFSNNGSGLPALTRRLNLLNHTSAILSFDATSTGVLDNGDVWQIEVNDGSSWTTIFTYDGDISGTLSPWLDISAYIDVMTQIRISIVSGFDEAGDYVYFDDIRIDVDCYCEGIAEAGASHSICPGNSTQIGDDPVLGYTYLWSPAATLSDATIANPIATPTEATTYYLTVTDSYNCEDTDEVSVSLFTEPSAVASNDGPLTCSQTSVDVSAFPNGLSYLWSTGATTQNISVGVIGIYYVTVTDGNGCTDTASSEVLEDVVPPIVDLGNDITSCESDELTITANGGGTYLWDDPEESTTVSITVSPSTPTSYTVTVTAANGCTASDEISVLINTLPNVDITLEDDQACSDETNVPLATGTPPGGTFSGTGVSGTTFNPQSAGVGTHIITYTFIDANGCSNFATAEMVVADEFIQSVSTGSEVECNGECDGNFSVDVDYSLVGDFNISYTYEGVVTNLGPYSTEDSITINNLCGGVYSDITVSAVDGSCLEINSTDVIITETNVGWEHVTWVNDVSDCDGICNGAFTVDANLGVTGEFNVSYDFEGTTYTVGPNNFAGDILINNLCAGVYTNITIISIETGCSDVWPDQIEIFMPEPDANISQIIDDLCNMSEGEVTINVQDGTWPYTITWQSVDGTQSGQQTLNAPGDTVIEGLSGGFVYCITVTDSNGCSAN